mgnify:CR=1 FL=1
MSDHAVREAYIVDGVRTPIGNHGGSLSEVRPDDMAAHVIRALLERHPGIDRARSGRVPLPHLFAQPPARCVRLACTHGDLLAVRLRDIDNYRYDS